MAAGDRRTRAHQVVGEDLRARLSTTKEQLRSRHFELLVSQTRSAIQQTKGGKDLHQAALLLEALAEDRPDDLDEAARAFAESGSTVARKVMRGLELAMKRWPAATPRQISRDLR